MLDFMDALLVASPGSIAVLGLLLVGGLYVLLSSPSHPVLNGKGPLEFRDTHAQKRFLSNARNLISSGLAKWPAFNLVTETGYRLVLDPKYAQEIRSHEALSFGKAIALDFHAHIPGFEPFDQGTRSDEIVQDAVRMKLTQSLGSVTKPLSDETTVALQKNWTDNADWHTIPLKHTILDIVAQLSSKVFLGDQICRDPDWLRITVAYTIDSFLAAEALRMWPAFMRSIVAPFSPKVQKIRAQLEEARSIIIPVLERRKAEKQAAIANGETPARYNDAMEWMEQCAKGRPYDAAVSQLSFSLAAIHTTSDMLTQVLYDICGHEGLIDELRQEVLTVIEAEGWQKTTLYKLKLMDSVLKESQRVKPIGIATMHRLAGESIKLSDGTVIPKNSNLMVSGQRMWDESIYPSPEKFDPYRFLRLRETPGKETSAQLVSPSPEHMGFGFGKHACPGRFFAANEIKIALCHMLLKYDFRLTEQWKNPRPIARGMGLSAEPRAEMEIRRRTEEINL
ncbi:cytochrome P450 [Aspergillus mulundensis]|uniref:Putative Cytochrome P450 n=1 Tax=Aspergillus mulundensis TaxID=1810919 RepID=A0A3D8R4Q9_9EURO|nr:putative Cytochrome P450 [Aspergillus mulundensis]RDW68967.1 putative Cytochrome P450 [Aspergillus mulundensis]